MSGQRRELGHLAQEASQALQAAATRPDRPAKDTEPASPEKAPALGDMTMRSWYMPKASADEIAAVVDDVHFATRLPKHLIMGALVNVVDRHRAEVEAEARAAGGAG